MAGFSEDLQTHYFENPSLPYLEIDSNSGFINPYSELNGIVLGNTPMNLQSVLGYCNDNFLSQMQPGFPAGCSVENLSGFPIANCAESLESVPFSQSPRTVRDGNQEPNMGNKKKRLMTVSDSNSGSSSSPVSEIGLAEDDKNNAKKIQGRGKRVKSGNKTVSNEKIAEKPREVIHVRARRGQATDSHSLAERVRREKINERMRCLQDLVPGCYKTMGMAVMLDEIINYVQSLQHQVEFLSMKLTAASSYYDFSSDLEAAETQQEVLLQQLYRI